ncbi:MAG: hypothetical protein A2271_02665 [Candidatus Moranbacteria bacterium RIFOXYA12_FULL_35_19]|nr:MAG: hypothetical protein UR78_C0006G0014 [Candidatus Moranbacteria bacterium GW2011_GWF2_35_39]OGI31818.1 MAG: hypothetical protein A2343_02990 [Candidatus Moranbacteria bacterium RIFOXYB12_FULL_35_8]OGI32696.1 MAG: hypothetical protein A2489_00100 [Candidatus Moranbacteria bacterium RIFOXYC12_FULL_36_13]OGI36702.1 MAG: hypothetical protein A2271_02665 [Candidatus Moranbacteria bacterium RIFOXYA12_FULL_35_19]
MTNEWPKNNKEKEISKEKKKEFISAWRDMVLIPEKTILDPKNLEDEEIKKWMYETLMEQIESLCEEWNLVPDENLIKALREEKNSELKSDLEVKYIQDCHKKIDNLIEKFDKSKSARWDSWPKKMKELGQFSCVGSSLIGLHMLEKAGIENYWGSPVSHAINVVRLSNGEWWYVDFLNGSGSVRKIKPELGEIEGVKVLKIKESMIEYEIIPIYNKEAAAGSVLGNFAAIICEAEDDIFPDSKNKKEAQEYIEKNKQYFSKVDFKKMYQKYFEKQSKIKETKEMEAERDRIDQIMGFQEGPIREYIESLSRDQREKYNKEAELNLKGIADFFINGNQDVLSKIGPELKKILELYQEAFKKVREDNEDEFVMIIDRLLHKQN